MAPISQRPHAALVVRRLREQRDVLGRLPRGTVLETARLLGISPRSLLYWLSPPPSHPRVPLTLSDDDLKKWAELGCSTRELQKHLALTRGRDYTIRSVQRALRKAPPAVKLYAKYGDDAQRYETGVFVSWDGPEHRREVWGLDHAYLKVPVWWDSNLLAPAWITLTVDLAPRVCPGYELSPARELSDDGEEAYDAPDATVVALALAYAMAEHPNGLNPFQGIPGELACDLALEFGSKQLLESLGDFDIDKPAMRPHRPNERGRIERLIGTMKSQLLPRLYGSDRSPKDWSNRVKGFDPARALLREELYARIEEWLDEYHHTPHSELGGKTPMQAWEEDIDVAA